MIAQFNQRIVRVQGEIQGVLYVRTTLQRHASKQHGRVLKGRGQEHAQNALCGGRVSGVGLDPSQQTQAEDSVFRTHEAF